MVTAPKPGDILSVVPIFEPEINAIIAKSTVKIVGSYPNANCLLLDKNCKYAPRATKDQTLKQIKHYAIDLVHVKTIEVKP